MSGVGLLTVGAVVGDGDGDVVLIRNVSFHLLLARKFSRFCRQNGFLRFFVDFGLKFLGFWMQVGAWVWGGSPG